MIHDPRFIFLGTGTSGGVPVIACDCPTCRSDDPHDTRSRSGAAVQWTDTQGRPRTVLIDATPDLRQQALRHNLTRCDAILFTHNHVDHIFGLDEVRRFCVSMGREFGIGPVPIDIYAEPHTMQALRRVYQHIFDKQANINESFVASLIPHEIHDLSVPITIHGMRFTPIRLLHGRLPILGYRVEPDDDRPLLPFPLAYCTDVSAIPTESWPLLAGLDTLVLDGLRHRRHPTHFTLDEATNVALRAEPRQTWLTHIAHEVRHAQTDPELPETVSLAYDGLTLSPAGPAPFQDTPAPRDRGSTARP